MSDARSQADPPSKFARLRNLQSHDFWARLFARPLAILLTYPVADVAWVTPNLLTSVSNLFMAGGIACLWLDQWIWAAVLLNLHLVFDNMDGTLARYRKCGTRFGFYYDKVSDYLGISAMFLSLGWLAFRQDPGSPHLVVVAAVLVIAETIGGYSKWVCECQRLQAHGNAPVPGAADKHKVPQRSAGQWVIWFFDSLWRIFLFEEVDYFFWVGIALVVGRLDWMLYLLAGTRVAGLLGTLVFRGVQMRKLDRKPV